MYELVCVFGVLEPKFFAGQLQRFHGVVKPNIKVKLPVSVAFSKFTEREKLSKDVSKIFCKCRSKCFNDGRCRCFSNNLKCTSHCHGNGSNQPCKNC